MRALVFVFVVGCAGETPQPVTLTAPPPPATTVPPPPSDTETTMHIRTSGDTREAVPLVPNWAVVGTGTIDATLGDVTNWHRHDPTGTCMPAALGAFVLKNDVDNGPADRGVALYNRAEGTILSFFTYPARHSLAEEIRTVTDGMCQGAGSMNADLRDVRFASTGIIAGCFHESRLGPAFEQALIFSRDGWFYEARFTFIKGDTPLERQYASAMSVAQKAFRACPK